MNSDAAQITEPAYLVALMEAESLPTGLRIAAETRFAAALERSLGGAEQVARTYPAWTAASECAAHDLDKEHYRSGDALAACRGSGAPGGAARNR